ncbi:glucokinase [Salinarimonas ramus]|uniref:Glucokinase n=1 Tax=Salinarimonas ramus TaxID=690164 RepID=A0A917QJY8_9HYPH|nr:glucokinase [Salinarimonas ramus]GGK53957.1 glucokinase [Salinarimonas ramus]
MTSLPHPLLVADVGGTNARFSLSESPGAPLVPVCRLRTKETPTVYDAVEQALAAAPVRAKTLVLCAAGPVLGREARLTNAQWVFDGADLAEHFGLAQGLLLNDFEAAALALAVLEPQDAIPIGRPVPPGGGPKLVLGPGTGLGMAALVTVAGRAAPLPGEAGHIGFGPLDEEDFRVFPRMERHFGRITPEAILSGPGLARLYKAMAADFGRDPDAVESDPPIVAARALSGECAHARATVDAFLKHLARFSGDMGIVFAATGGVVIRGGVMASLAPLVEETRFRTLFEEKAPVEALARAVPLMRLPSDDVILRAMAAVGADPDRFVIDYPARLWRI